MNKQLNLFASSRATSATVIEITITALNEEEVRIPLNADAQQILDGSLIKCFTTLKRFPFSQQHFWQQIAYVLMDWDNEYQIDKVCWYYSRQNALFVHPVESLFKDLPSLRLEFQEFLLRSYGNISVTSSSRSYKLHQIGDCYFDEILRL